MAVKSGFFMSVNGDRRYDAAFFAEYFASFIGNGIFPNPSTNLQVVEGNNMQTVVKPGKGWINGYYVHNDSNFILQHDAADGVLKRIDRIVLQWNYLTRQIVITLKKGVPASSPVAPVIVRNTDYYELVLADVYINNGTTFITQSNITDRRFNTNLCGIVKGTVDEIDTTTVFAQYQSAFDDFMEVLEVALGEDVAGNLLNMINQTNENVAKKYEKSNTGIPKADLASDVQATLNKVVDGGINQKGLLQLEDSVTSTSITEASTPKNVKQAYDVGLFAKGELGRYQVEFGSFDNGTTLFDLDQQEGSTLNLINTLTSTGNSATRSGIRFIPQVDITSLTVDIHDSSTGITKIYVKDVTAGSIMLTQNVAAKKVLLNINLVKNKQYEILVDNAGSTYQPSYQNGVTYPFSNAELNVTASIWNGSVSTVLMGVFKSITVSGKKGLSGEVFKTVTPSDLKKWGNVKFDKVAPTNTNVVVDVLSSGNAVLKSNIQSLQDLSDIDTTTHPLLKLQFTLSRNSTLDPSPIVSNPSVTWEGDGNILTDTITGEKYKLKVTNGALTLVEV